MTKSFISNLPFASRRERPRGWGVQGKLGAPRVAISGYAVARPKSRARRPKSRRNLRSTGMATKAVCQPMDRRTTVIWRSGFGPFAFGTGLVVDDAGHRHVHGDVAERSEDVG